MNTPELKKERQHSHIHTHHRQKKTYKNTKSEIILYKQKTNKTKIPYESNETKSLQNWVCFVLDWTSAARHEAHHWVWLMHPVSLSPFLSQAFISESLLLLCLLCLKGGKALLLSEVFSFSPGCTFKIGARSSLHGKAWPNQQVQARGYHSSDHNSWSSQKQVRFGVCFQSRPNRFCSWLK